LLDNEERQTWAFDLDDLWAERLGTGGQGEHPLAAASQLG